MRGKKRETESNKIQRVTERIKKQNKDRQCVNREIILRYISQLKNFGFGQELIRYNMHRDAKKEEEQKTQRCKLMNTKKEEEQNTEV